MKKLSLLLIIATLLATSCATVGPEYISDAPLLSTESVILDNAAKARLDRMLSSYVYAGDVAGISALVYENGQEQYYNAYGHQDRENGIRMNRNTIVKIYSMTKPITGVALMTLYEQGAFELDDPLEKYAPEFANMQVYDGVNPDGSMKLVPAKRSITIRDITRHTAGFVNRGDIPGLSEVATAADPTNRENTLSEMAQKLASIPLWFHPGEQWEYGVSVDVQAYLVEKLSGVRYRDYVRQNVLDPLGMNETRYYVPEEDRDRFAAMYYRSDEGELSRLPDDEAHIENFEKWPLDRGGWGLTSTLDDYMKFVQMLANGGTLDGTQILKPETIELMATNHLDESIEERSWLPSKGQVGFGIDFAVRLRAPADAQENFGHVGEFFWDGAASTLFWVDPVHDLTAVLFVQLFPYDKIKLHKSFRDAVYGANQELYRE